MNNVKMNNITKKAKNETTKKSIKNGCFNIFLMLFLGTQQPSILLAQDEDKNTTQTKKEETAKDRFEKVISKWKKLNTKDNENIMVKKIIKIDQKRESLITERNKLQHKVSEISSCGTNEKQEDTLSDELLSKVLMLEKDIQSLTKKLYKKIKKEKKLKEKVAEVKQKMALVKKESFDKINLQKKEIDELKVHITNQEKDLIQEEISKIFINKLDENGLEKLKLKLLNQSKTKKLSTKTIKMIDEEVKRLKDKFKSNKMIKLSDSDILKIVILRDQETLKKVYSYLKEFQQVENLEILIDLQFISQIKNQQHKINKMKQLLMDVRQANNSGSFLSISHSKTQPENKWFSYGINIDDSQIEAAERQMTAGKIDEAIEKIQNHFSQMIYGNITKKSI